MPFCEWLPGLAQFVGRDAFAQRPRDAPCTTPCKVAQKGGVRRRRPAIAADLGPVRSKAVRGAVVFAPGRDPKQSAQERHVLSGGRWIMQPLGRVSLVRSAGSVM